MTARFTITRATPGRLHARGRIDVGNAATVLDHCRDLAPGGVTTVDLGALDSADSVTLAVLLAWAARVSESGGRLDFVAVPARLRALAHLSDAEPLLGFGAIGEDGLEAGARRPGGP